MSTLCCGYMTQRRILGRGDQSCEKLNRLDDGFCLVRCPGGQKTLLFEEFGLYIKIKSEGYIPKSGLFMVNVLKGMAVQGLRVLDIGTGETGIIAQCLKAKGAGNVTACDIDPEAVQHASRSSRLSPEVQWIISNTFENIPTVDFDLIVSNPPQMPMAAPGNIHDYGGLDGRRHIVEILEQSAGKLSHNGRLVLLCFDFLGTECATGEAESFKSIGERLGFASSVMARKERSVRAGGETERNLQWIRHVYPHYRFAVNDRGELVYNLHVMLFEKNRSL